MRSLLRFPQRQQSWDLNSACNYLRDRGVNSFYEAIALLAQVSTSLPQALGLLSNIENPVFYHRACVSRKAIQPGHNIPAAFHKD